MQELRRTRSGQFNESQAHSLHELRDVIDSENRSFLQSMIIPVESAVGDLSHVIVVTRQSMRYVMVPPSPELESSA